METVDEGHGSHDPGSSGSFNKGLRVNERRSEWLLADNVFSGANDRESLIGVERV